MARSKISPELKNQILEQGCVIGHGCQRPLDIHHIRSVGAGGRNDPFNLVALCRYHHCLLHHIGLNKFTEKYSSFKEFLENRGWYIDEYTKRWAHKNIYNPYNFKDLSN
jgi:hypothetical protein